uniref:Uncharacterized protein n=1 Tax=Oryza rufipogon TaxID=4529 RepID=A0A0E0RG06_ORYRU
MPVTQHLGSEGDGAQVQYEATLAYSGAVAGVTIEELAGRTSSWSSVSYVLDLGFVHPTPRCPCLPSMGAASAMPTLPPAEHHRHSRTATPTTAHSWPLYIAHSFADNIDLHLMHEWMWVSWVTSQDRRTRDAKREWQGADVEVSNSTV